jgi:hypothetical protein
MVGRGNARFIALIPGLVIASWQRTPVPEKTRHCRIRAWFGVGLARGLLACPVRLKKVPLIQKQDPRVP